MSRRYALFSLFLALCLLITGCSKPAQQPDSDVPASQPDSSVSSTPAQPDSQPESTSTPPALTPEEELALLAQQIVTNVDRPMPDFETIPFAPTATPYTAQEAEALTGDEPWRQDSSFVFVQAVIDGYEFYVASNPPRLTDNPFNGTLVAICQTPDRRTCLLTADGSIWLEDWETGEYELAGTLPGVDAVTIDTLWAASACDGEVFWFAYGTQVARVYLPTGRVDVGTLSQPCRLFKPLTRGSLYCLYEEYPDYHSTITEKSGATFLKFLDDDVLLPVTQARYDLDAGTESTLTASQTLQLQWDGCLMYSSENRKDAWDKPQSYADYFAGEYALHTFEQAVEQRHRSLTPVLAYAAYPFHYDTDQTRGEGSLRNVPRQPDASLLQKDLYLYYHRNMGAQYDATAQWTTAQLAIHLDCPLNGHILQTHFDGGSLYIWTDENRLYSSDPDGQNPRLLLDLTDSIAPDSADELQVLFAGPTFWLKQGESVQRVYLPDGTCETAE